MNMHEIQELDIRLRTANQQDIPFRYFEIEERGELRVYGEIKGANPVLIAINGRHLVDWCTFKHFLIAMLIYCIAAGCYLLC